MSAPEVDVAEFDAALEADPSMVDDLEDGSLDGLTDDAEEEVDVDEIDEDFAPVDVVETVIGLLVAGESRNAVARALRISREEVDARVAEATADAEAEALNEREFIVRERMQSLVRQSSAFGLPSTELDRLALLLALAKLELELIGWARRRQGVTS